RPEPRQLPGADEPSELALLNKHRSERLSAVPGGAEDGARLRRGDLNFDVGHLSTPVDQRGVMTTYLCGSTPAESLVRPAAATTSCTTLRSNGFIGSSSTDASPAFTLAMASSATAVSSALRERR